MALTYLGSTVAVDTAFIPRVDVKSQVFSKGWLRLRMCCSTTTVLATQGPRIVRHRVKSSYGVLFSVQGALFLLVHHTASGAASLMLYSSSSTALRLSFRGLKSTTKASLTAKTESLSRYLLCLSKICVTSGAYLSPLPAYDMSLVTNANISVGKVETNHNVNVSRAVRVAIQELQQLASRS